MSINIDVKGNSGCTIDILDDNGKLYIKKFTNDKKYIDRLYLQGCKQQTESNTENIKVPYIYDLHKDNNEAFILMDYIYSKNFIDYFEHASPSDINYFINTFINYIEKEFSECTITSVEKKIFIDKLDSVIKNTHTNFEQLSIISYQLKNAVYEELEHAKSIIKYVMPDEIQLPVGKCHGDLTFSNILFTNNNFYFIDYLDSFIETPLQDIVKLRQDTVYLWSTKMYKKCFDSIRLKMIFEYIDNKIDTYFKNNEYYTKYYYFLQLINITRIIPYIKSAEICEYLKNIIHNLNTQLTSANG